MRRGDVKRRRPRGSKRRGRASLEGGAERAGESRGGRERRRADAVSKRRRRVGALRREASDGGFRAAGARAEKRGARV